MRKLIRADGSSVELRPGQTVQQIERLIGAEFGLDTVRLKHLGDPLHVMLVDDVGHLKRLPINHEATLLYHANCWRGSDPPPIRGDVVVLPDREFEGSLMGR